MKTKQSSYPFVSVVIPAYNEEKFISKTLESLENQNYPKNRYEIIVVDNGSTDNTRQIAKQFGARVVKENKKGVQHARQAGFMAARGDYIASTDADNILPKKWILTLSSELLAHKNVVAVGGWFELRHGSILTKTAINKLSNPVLATYKLLSQKNVLIGQNFMVKKDIFLKTRGFLGLQPMNEDLMFAQRLSKFGKIKLFYGKNWNVITSPRRWKESFILGTAPYFINAISYAVANKLLIENFTDIRNEKSKFKLPSKMLAVTIGLIILLGFAASTATPAQAKLYPIRKNVAQKITNTKLNIKKIYNDNKKDINENILFLR